MALDYESMQIGERLEMPILTKWEGVNQDLYHEICAYCKTAEGRPQFQVESDRFAPGEIRYWLQRTR